MSRAIGTIHDQHASGTATSMTIENGPIVRGDAFEHCVMSRVHLPMVPESRFC